MLTRQQVNQCLRRLSATLNPAAVRRRLTGRPERSRRMNYATSVAMGHGGPQMALESYIHLADICLADQLRQQKPTELRDHALTYGLSQGGSTLRVTRLRLKKKCLLRSEDYTHEHLLTSFAERQAWPDLASLLAPKPSIPELPAPAMTVEAQRFEPSDLDRLLSLVRLRKCHEGLAEAFHLDEETIDTILSQASAVEKISGFTLFGVGGGMIRSGGALTSKVTGNSLCPPASVRPASCGQKMSAQQCQNIPMTSKHSRNCG